MSLSYACQQMQHAGVFKMRSVICRLVHCSSVRLQLPGLLQLQDQVLTPHTQPSSSSHSSYSSLSNTTIPYHGGSCSSTTSTSVERQPVVRVQGEERLRSQVSAAPAVAAPARGGVSGLQWVSFCRATHTPALLATLNDGSVCVLRLREVRCEWSSQPPAGVHPLSAHACVCRPASCLGCMLVQAVGSNTWARCACLWWFHVWCSYTLRLTFSSTACVQCLCWGRGVKQLGYCMRVVVCAACRITTAWSCTCGWLQAATYLRLHASSSHRTHALQACRCQARPYAPWPSACARCPPSRPPCHA